MRSVLTKVAVKKGTYRDSITLLKISSEASATPGIRRAAVVMATALNKRLLGDLGFDTAEVKRAGSNDLLIALEAEDERTLEGALAEVSRQLYDVRSTASDRGRPRTLAAALELMPDANLAMISVPGEFAKTEARRALEKGLHAFVFSSNVSVADELELKQFARDKHLLFMGPDCGTAIINGVVIGFGNVVNRGPVGIVSASGTGLQQVSVLVHDNGLGISQAIGTGGNDLSEAIGGTMMIEGIRRLEEDDGTKAIVLISKLPSPPTAERVLAIVRGCRKPVVVNFIGRTMIPGEFANGFVAQTLEDAANLVCSLLRGEKHTPSPFAATQQQALRVALGEASKLNRPQKYVRGLFSGGTLCYEAMVIMAPLLGGIYSNTPLDPDQRLKDANESLGHTCVDMGSEEFTVGRLHPMVDFTLRKIRLSKEARDPESAVVLLDVVLGIGSNPDPGAELVPLIEEVREFAMDKGRYLPVVASVIGTQGDPQNLTRQRSELEGAGVIVMPSNAQAARMAAVIASRGMEGVNLFGGKYDARGAGFVR